MRFLFPGAAPSVLEAADVRLEYPAFSEGKKDRWVVIWVKTADVLVAIELKYITRAARLATGDGEVFKLKNHDAPDQRRFDYVYDGDVKGSTFKYLMTEIPTVNTKDSA